MPLYQYPEDLAISPDLKHWVIFYIYTRGDAALPATAPIAATGGAGTQAGFQAPGRRDVALETATLSTDAIALHVDEKPSARYGAIYDNVSLTEAGLAAFAGSAAVATSSKRLSERAKMLVTGFAGLVAAGTSTVGRAVGATTKIRINPFKKIYFDQMDFRVFQFKYRFFPRSPAEAASVKNIIDQFKYHMHPEITDPVGTFMVYPSEFEIIYFWDTTENNYWHKISRCVLKTLSVDYGGENFSSFDRGVPSEVYLTLEFQETELLDKNRIASGY